MLVALIDTKEARADKRKGDVVVVKLPDSPWGKREDKEFIRAFIKDDELEAQLVLKRAKGENHPHIVHPYAEYVEVDRGDGEMVRQRVRACSKPFDVDAISEACVVRSGKTREQLLDRETPTPVLTAGDVQIAFVLKTKVLEEAAVLEIR